MDELVEYMAYCYATRGNRKTTIAGKLVAINVFVGSGWEIAATRLFLDQSREGGNQTGAHKRRHLAMGEEPAAVGDVEV